MAGLPDGPGAGRCADRRRLRAWQGLGYNRRAVNLQRAARVIVDEHDGQRPEPTSPASRRYRVSGPTRPERWPHWRSGIPVGAVDTNVRRVLGRIVAGGIGVLDAATHATRRRCVRSARPTRVLDARPDGHRRDALQASAYRCARRARRDRGAATSRTAPSDARPAAAAARRPRVRRSLPEHLALAARPDRRATQHRPERRVGRHRGPIGDHDQHAVDRALEALARDGVIELDDRDDRLAAAPDCRHDRAGRLGFGGDARDRPSVLIRRRRPAACGRPVDLLDGPPRAPRRGGPPRRPCRPSRPPRWSAPMRAPRPSASRRTDSWSMPGTAVAAAVKALAVDLDRWGTGPIVILCGPGNNGGDGYVAARRLALAGAHVIVAVVATDMQPQGGASGKKLGPDRARRRHRQGPHARAARRRDLRQGHREGRGRRGRACSGRAFEARSASRSGPRSSSSRAPAPPGVPIVAVDTPTALDLSSGEPSDPVVHADLTVTFHRAKTGLVTRQGAAYAGRVLVAPIGIPAEADRG